MIAGSSSALVNRCASASTWVASAPVYRHFPDEETIFAACSAHWLSQQVPPEPGAWSRIADPVERLGAGLADLYRFYREGEPMLSRVYADKAALPPGHQRAIDERDRHVRDVLLEPFTVTKRRRRRLCAVLGHAVSFWTWRSLCMEHGLSNREAVDAMIALAVAAAAR